MLKDHYLQSDEETVLKELQKSEEIFEKIKTMNQNATFEEKDKLLKELTFNLEMFMMLHRKKIDCDIEREARTYVGSKTYV